MRKTGYGILHLFCAAWLASATSPRAETAADTVGPAAPAPVPAVVAATAASPEPDKVDSSGLPPLDELESKVRSTLLFGGSSPVSFSGEARLHISQHDFYNYPSYLSGDQTWTQANWEGNESMLRLAMVVHASRNAVLWSKIGFQNTLPGIYTNGSRNPNLVVPNGYTPVQDRHDKADLPANIHEDMAAGIAIRTVPASFWIRMGNVIWTEASPLTIWKSQPRTFAWDYLPFEIEQPISRYYEYNIAKGEKAGRAAWNKKAFNGVDMKSIDLPMGFETQVMWAAFERYDNFEREFIDFSNDLGLANLSNYTKQIGIGDSYRHMYHARIANTKVVPGMTLGLNAVGFVYKPDITENPDWRKNFSVTDTLYTYAPTGQRFTVSRGYGFYKDPLVGSIDLRGPVNEKLDLHLEVAVSYLDTVKSIFALDSTHDATSGRTSLVTKETRWEKHADPVPAFYGKVVSNYGVPVKVDLAYIPKGFYSPFSFAAPVDGFYPVGSNLVGAGKFIARGEASPYSQNMAGMFVSVSPQVGYGHLHMTYGQHFQIQKAQDVLYFPYRLNGQDFNSVFQSSYNRWGNDAIDVSMKSGKYSKRLGDESFHSLSAYGGPVGYSGGGLRSDYLSMFESFVPYENAAQADSNSSQTIKSVFVQSQYVPVHQKYSFNVDLDGAWDIAPFIGYSHDLFLSGYMALNGVSSTLKPMAFSPKDMMLWGLYLRAEPAIALSDKLYVLGLLGYENWRSDMAYMTDAASGAVLRVPIDYKDWAYGAGFDWDFAARVGFHARAKWMKHEDKNFSANDWATPYYSAEIKMWF